MEQVHALMHMKAVDWPEQQSQINASLHIIFVILEVKDGILIHP